jgi:copper chaperone CopZ
MKLLKGFIMVAAFFLFNGMGNSFAQEAAVAENTGESTFTVLGNCGMCKDRIERAAYSVRGVRSASWDQKGKQLTVRWRPDRTTQDEIERAVAKAGHDTENFLADDETHANLHHCCVYERDPDLLKKNKRHNDK